MVYLVQIAPTSSAVGQVAKDLELIIRHDGEEAATPGWSAEVTRYTKSSPVAASAIDVGPGGDGGASVSAVFPFSSLADLHQPFYWSATEVATDLGTITGNPAHPYDTTTLGLMSNSCPQADGVTGPEHSAGVTLRFPTPRGAPPGRGTFADARRLPAGLAPAIETAMGQGWAPFSHFSVRLDSDPHDSSWGEVFVSSLVGSTPVSEPGQAVVHHVGGKNWQLATGLGQAWPCTSVPDQVITDLDLDASVASGCTSSGELAHPGVTVPKDAGVAPNALWDAVEAQTLPVTSPISFAAAVVYDRADPADQSWVEYYVAPSAASAGSFPNGTGLAHKVEGTWTIVTAPAASADCSPNVAAPTAVLRALKVQSGGSCALASPTTTTTVPSGTPSSSAPLATGVQTVTAAEPPQLLADLQATTSGIPSNELTFTYEVDPSDSAWVSWGVQGAPGYTADVQPAGGFAHWTGSNWQVWGPGSEEVGCTGQGSLGPVPIAVLAAFGDSCGG